MIDNEIIQEYSNEARELLEEMDNSLMSLETEGESSELLNTIFRTVHCIKGSAEYIGLERSSTLTHAVENLLDRLREGQIEMDPHIIDFLFRAKDLISNLVEEVASEQEEKSDITAMMDELATFVPQAAAPPTHIPLPEPEFEPTFEESPQHMETAEGDVSAETDVFPELESLLDSREVSDFDSGLDSEISTEFETGVESDTIPAFEVHEETEPYDLPTEEYTETPEKIVSEGIAEALQPLDEAEPSEAEEETTTAEELIAGTTLVETVPHILNLTLYLDDLEDGMPAESIAPALLETIDNLLKSVDYIGLSGAVDVLNDLKSHFNALMETTDERVDAEQIRTLRVLIQDLQSLYPPETFPLEEPTLPEPEPSPIREIPEDKVVLARQLFPIPSINDEIIDSVYAAGYRTLDELTKLDTQALTSITGITETVASDIRRAGGAIPTEITTIRRRRQKVAETQSLMADVDDSLLNEFEGIFGDSIVIEEIPPPEEARHAQQAPKAPPAPKAGLLDQLDLVAEETDREIVDIFLSYGWEILDKLRPQLENMKLGLSAKADLEECADWIKSIRSSSTYMDYQSLATFLDDWFERTLWVANNIETPSPQDLEFMQENFEQLEKFFGRLEHMLKTAEEEAPELPESATIAERAMIETARIVEEITALAEPTVDMEVSEELPTEGDLISSETMAITSEVKSPIGEPSPTEERIAAAVARTGATPTEHAPKPSRPQPAEAPESVDVPQESPVVRTMRVDATKVDTLLNQVGELVVNRSYVEQLSLELKDLQRELAAATEIGKKDVLTIKNVTLRIAEASLSLGRVATDLQEGVMKLRMLPIGQLFNRMPRLIRDLSRRVGKSVSLEIHGGETEVDKRVIEQIYNPLVHIIRNAVDHGIENRDARLQSGKSPEGSIRLGAYSQGNQVIIDVEDDGKGIDSELVLRKAHELNLLDPQEARTLSMQEIYNFLFVPGFSTSDRVTRTSGRGVGMDVVKKDVEKINGQVDVVSWTGRGTRISIKIPLTLAIIQTLLIRSASHHFAIPLVSVREIIQIPLSDITTIEGVEVIKFREETIPILRLKEVFNLDGGDELSDPSYVVLATTGQNTIGFLVEGLVGEQDVVIKPLAEHVFKSRGLAGSTILGDGTIALVMDVAELIEHIVTRQREYRKRMGQLARGRR